LTCKIKISGENLSLRVSLTSHFFYVALSVLLAPGVSMAANDGEALPIYPHTNKGGTAHEPTNEKAVNQAVIHGDNASLYTTDAPQTVDHWYQEKLPKSFARNAITETTWTQALVEVVSK
jgi:hypothetical protein